MARGGGSLNILNVAEKPSVARALSSVFSQMPNSRDAPAIRNQAAQIFVIDNVIFPSVINQGSGQMINGHSHDRPHKMIVTSVRGHLASTEFPPSYGWNAVPPIALFEAPIDITYKEDMEPLKNMLQNQARGVDAVILWLDCDREGEAICDEVRTVCLQGNPRLNDKVYRAKFSTVLPQEIKRALSSLGRVNEFFVQAVQARSEHDLRVGAAFTRFQTLRLQKKFEEFANHGVISYGPCQFPTLGFVVERWARIETFIPETFWYLEMKVTVNSDGTVAGLSQNENEQPMQQRNEINSYGSAQNNTSKAIFLKWYRERLYDRTLTLALYESCLHAQEAEVISLTGRPKNKWRPIPLATVELQKRASRYLRIGSETLMTAAEELYQQGLISYPRTETEKFRPEFQHMPLIQSFQGIPGEFGDYASKLLRDNNFQYPRAGRNDDAAHPPITPCKAVDPQTINDPNQRKIYILIVKHYLACCSKDAVGKETVLKLRMASEEFTATGLMIVHRNWLEIYSPWERWSTGQGELPNVQVGSRIIPASFLMKEGSTTAPFPISEVELISLMDRNGIGTDATIAQHITTIQDRAYAIKDNQQRFLPTKLGIALVEGYNSMGYQLNRPDLRREMEAECNAVATGRKQKEEIMQPILAKMRECFEKVSMEAHKLDAAVARHFTRMGTNNSNSTTITNNFSICGDCNGMTTLKELNTGSRQGRHGNRSNNNNLWKPKLLHCATCSIGMRLPKGVPTPSMHPQLHNQPQKCPICNYQVLHIKQGDGYNGNGYHLCPKCYTEAPAAYGGTATSGEFRCFNCTHTTCQLATGTRGGDVQVFKCPFCKANGSTNGEIYLRKNSRGYILSCSNYSSSNRSRCEYTIWLPREASSVSVAENKNRNDNAINSNNGGESNTGSFIICNRCSTNSSDAHNGGGEVVRKLTFQWKPGSIPPGLPRTMTACVLCDEILKSDFNLSIPQLNQVQIRGGRQPSNNTNYFSTGVTGRGGGYTTTTGTSVARNIARSSSRSRERVFNNNQSAGRQNGRGGSNTLSSTEIICYKCGQPGHYSSRCTNNNNNNNTN